MPPVQLPDEDENRPSAFTVLERDGGRREADGTGEARRVLAVKPQQRVPAPPEPSSPHCMLDPKFYRALDFRLRRLQEKETLRANLSRPTRARQRRSMAASEPVLAARAAAAPMLSGSQPRLYAPDATVGASPSPGRRGRASLEPGESDKPRFVTTVKTGQFLLPPPEIACLLGLETLYPPQERDKIVYSYASRPKAVTTHAKHLPPEKKQNGTATEGAARARVSSLFGGVRALVAGVVGMRSLHGYVMSCNRRRRLV